MLFNLFHNGSNGHRVRICIGSMNYYGPFRKTREAAARDLLAMRFEDSAVTKKELLQNLVRRARDVRCRNGWRARFAGREEREERLFGCIWARTRMVDIVQARRAADSDFCELFLLH